MAAKDIVTARLGEDLKNKASETLERMGMTPSQVIKMLMLRIVQEQKLPFEVKVPEICAYGCPHLTPNQETLEAFEDKGEKFSSEQDLFKDLGI